jgi:hypothetical protein
MKNLFGGILAAVVVLIAVFYLAEKLTVKTVPVQESVRYSSEGKIYGMNDGDGKDISFERKAKPIFTMSYSKEDEWSTDLIYRNENAPVILQWDMYREARHNSLINDGSGFYNGEPFQHRHCKETTCNFCKKKPVAE